MKTNRFFKTQTLLCLLALGFVGCSNNEDFAPQAEQVQTVQDDFTKRLAGAIYKAATSDSQEALYVVADGESKEIITCNENDYVLGMVFYTITTDRTIESKDVNVRKGKKNGGWTYAGNVKGKLSALKLASTLSSKLPSDKTIDIRIVPKGDGSKDVYYKVS